jgi:nitroreductase
LLVVPQEQRGMPSVVQTTRPSADFFELLKSRRSVRAFRDRAPSDDQLERILLAARSAPSAGDLQAYEVVVVRDSSGRSALMRAAFGQRCLSDAPVVLVFLMNPARSGSKYGDRGARLYACQDATIAAAYAQLAAHALGLGSVWVGAFDDDGVRYAIEAQQDLVPSSLLAIGYPAESPEPTPRRELADFVRRERYSNGMPWSRCEPRSGSYGVD